MQTYVVDLQSEVAKSFRCQKAANSLDIDVEKKSKHHLEVSVDMETPFNLGLIVGASGSGKTTLAKQMFGEDCFISPLDMSKPIIEQFPKEWSYDDCAAALAGIGLTSVPCWIRPVYTLSNGQRARAEAALLMASDRPRIIIDEWTSVVDRTVAKAMSNCIQKYARKSGKQIILLSCHYDVVEWLNPDFIVDCNKQSYEDRRSMVGSHTRSDRLRFDIRECGRGSWRYFSKYHYLSERLPGGRIFTFGLYHGEEQIGFQCFAAYIIGDHKTFFSNRTVVHPDYVGLGLGMKLITESSKIMVERGYRVKAKFSSVPVYKAMNRDPLWRCTAINRPIKKLTVGLSKEKGGESRSACLRSKTTTYHFDFVYKKQNQLLNS